MISGGIGYGGPTPNSWEKSIEDIESFCLCLIYFPLFNQRFQHLLKYNLHIVPKPLILQTNQSIYSLTVQAWLKKMCNFVHIQ